MFNFLEQYLTVYNNKAYFLQILSCLNVSVLPDSCNTHKNYHFIATCWHILGQENLPLFSIVLYENEHFEHMIVHKAAEIT